MASAEQFFGGALALVVVLACVLRLHAPARNRWVVGALAFDVLNALGIGVFGAKIEVGQVLIAVLVAGLVGYFAFEILRVVGYLVGEALHGTATIAGRLIRAVAPWVIGASVVLAMFKWAPELFNSLVALGLMAGVLWFMVRRIGRR